MAYEMLVGDPPHAASTSQAVIAKVLTEKPANVRVGRPSVAPHVDAAIGRALEKLAADRFSTAKEFAEAIQGHGVAPTVDSAAGYSGARPNGRSRERAAWSLVAGLVGLVAWLVMWPRSPVAEAPVVRANFDLPPNVRVNDVLAGSTIAVSPGGDMIAFTSISVSGFQMFLRRIDEISARVVGDGNVAGRNLAFSPDGRWLGFTEGNVLKKIAVDGGQVTPVGSTGGSVPYGITWSDTDTIYIGGFSGMWKVSANGGDAVPVGSADSSTVRLGRRWPYILPDGKAILFASGNSSSAVPRLSVITTGTEQSSEFSPVMAAPLGLIGDQLVYVSPTGGLMAVRFDTKAHRPIGDAVQLDEGVLVDPTSGIKASLSRSGTLAYLRGRAQFQPVVLRAGGTTGTPLIAEPGTYSTPRFSPDGRKVAMGLTTTNAQDIWIYDIDRNTFTRLTTEGANVRPEWTPDGRHVVFIAQRAGKPGVWRQAVDGSGPAERLFERELEPFEALVSPDARWLVIRTAPGSAYSRDILAMPLGGDTSLTPIVTGPYTESLPRISPDSKWLAYQSNETTRFEIYVKPFPGPGARVQVSDLGGTEPIWGKDGKSLYYRGPVGEVVKVDVTTGASFSIGRRQVMLTGDYLTDSSHPNWDVAPDGRFLMLKRAGAEAQTIVVHNWGRELREKTANRR
jgi:serine/threonine-protein kinase